MLSLMLAQLRLRADQLRTHLDALDRDKGALSIELALLVGALVTVALIIVGIIVAKVTEKGTAIG
jgi:Flp pilus assembly pilin Flp